MVDLYPYEAEALARVKQVIKGTPIKVRRESKNTSKIVFSGGGMEDATVALGASLGTEAITIAQIRVARYKRRNKRR